MAERTYEVLVRRPDGHETVLRVTASSKPAAAQLAADRYHVDLDTIVSTVVQEPGR